MSARIVSKCIRHVLGEILCDLLHNPKRVQSSVERTIDFLSRNPCRTHPKRDRRTGRLKLELEHVYAGS